MSDEREKLLEQLEVYLLNHGRDEFDALVDEALLVDEENPLDGDFDDGDGLDEEEEDDEDEPDE